MAIDFDAFLSWAEKKFEGDVVVAHEKGEIKLNSVFCEDCKHHLWCNPSGGRNGRKHGVYRCWKTDRRGSLVSLVMHVEGCSYEEALEKLGTADMSMAELEKKLEAVFWGKPVPDEREFLGLPPGTVPVSSLPQNNYFRISAELHMESRRLPVDGVLVCTEGEYSDRIVIPYYDRGGDVVYYNSRYLGSDKKSPRYMGPPAGEKGLGKGDVVYMTSWPDPGAKVYFCEGEFDAMSLKAAGFHAGAYGGKSVSESQAIIISQYVPVICLDGDASGKDALPAAGDALLSHGVREICYVRPPEGYKDWNDLHKAVGPKVVRHYVLKNERRCDTLEFTMR